MADKIYSPETIDDSPLPGESNVIDFTTPTSGSGENKTTGTTETPDNRLPEKLIAVEVMGSALNTKAKKVLQEFNLEQRGGFQIGKYDPGNSGDVRITPNGITARDSAGSSTFSLDGTTGSAVFAGELRSGSLITGDIVVGNNAVIISGDTDKPRMVFYNNNIPEIVIGEVS